MFNNIALDIFIGLAFIYLLYSLLAATLQEVIARWYGLRGRMLVKAIRRMLEDEKTGKSLGLSSDKYTLAGFIVAVRRNISRFYRPFDKGNDSFAKAFFAYPSIKYLGENSWNSKPSYLEASTFSQTLIYMLRGNEYDGTTPQMNLIRDRLFIGNIFEKNNSEKSNIEGETLRHLQRLFNDAHSDVDRFKVLIENWFNETMNRTTGWYKRQTQLILFFVGLFVAFSFNVDTIAIYNILAKEKKVRDAMVELATKAPEKYKPILDSITPSHIKEIKTTKDSGKITEVIKETVYTSPTDSFLEKTRNSLQNDAEEVNNILGLGKPFNDTLRQLREKTHCINSDSPDYKANKDKYIRYKKMVDRRPWLSYSNKQKGGWSTIVGWLLTALAISLGAPFWFDLLNKLVQLRSSGPKPQNDSIKPETKEPDTNSSSPVKRVG